MAQAPNPPLTYSLTMITSYICDDVLDTIFHDCDFPSLRTLVGVSARFRALALPCLLRSVSFKKDLIQLVSFLKLVEGYGGQQGGKTPGIGRHVRRLEIASSAFCQNRRWHLSESILLGKDVIPEYTDIIPPDTWAPILATALGFMPNLREFVLGDQMEEAIQHSPQLTSTLLACNHLRALSLAGVGAKTSASLDKACSSLSPTLRLDFMSLSTVTDEDSDTLWGISVVLEEGLGRFLHHVHIRQHITSLFLSALDFEELTHLNPKYPVLFPSLGKLELLDCRTSLQWLAAAAPGIHTLILTHGDVISSGPLPGVAFPHLVYLCARYDQIMTMMGSNPLVIQNLRCLRVRHDWGAFVHEDPAPFAIPKAASRLKSLTFCLGRMRDVSWWHAFCEVVAPLQFLNITLKAHSVGEVGLCVSILLTVHLDHSQTMSSAVRFLTSLQVCPWNTYPSPSGVKRGSSAS